MQMLLALAAAAIAAAYDPWITPMPLKSAGPYSGPVYFIVAVNCSDFVNLRDLSSALERHLALMAELGIRADYSFTAELAERLAQSRPDLIQRLKRHSLSIHGANRPPYPMPRQMVSGESWQADLASLSRWASQHRDLLTGAFDSSRPGGVVLWKQIFGREPVCCGRPCEGPVAAALLRYANPQIAAGIGENVGLPSNEGWWMGLLGRPDHVFIKPGQMRAAALAGNLNFLADQYAKLVAAWTSDRPLVLVQVIHLKDMYAAAHGWISNYPRGANPGSRRLRPTPALPAAEQEKIWRTYRAGLEWLIKRGARAITPDQLFEIIADDRSVPAGGDIARLCAQRLAWHVQAAGELPPWLWIRGRPYSLADIWQVLVAAAAGRPLKSTARVAGIDQLAEPAALQAASPEQVREAARRAISALEKRLQSPDGQRGLALIPGRIALNGQQINAAQLMYACALVLLGRDPAFPALKALPAIYARAQKPATTLLTYWTYKPCRWRSWGQVPVFTSIVMHNEEPLHHPTCDYLNRPELYRQQRDMVIRFAKLLKQWGAVLDWQSDWTFLVAEARYTAQDRSLLEQTGGKTLPAWLQAQRHAVEPHAHETQYNYADVAHLLRTLGANPLPVVGGFLWYPPDNEQGWEKFRQPYRGRVFPNAIWRAEVLWGAGTKGHRGPDVRASGIWRPKDRYHFMQHDPEANLIYVGGYVPTAVGLADLLARARRGELDASLMFTQTLFAAQQALTEASLARWQSLLASLAPYVEDGSLVFMPVYEQAKTWKIRYGERPNIYKPPEELTQQGPSLPRRARPGRPRRAF